MSFSKPRFEVAHIIAEHRNELETNNKLSAWQKKVFTDLTQCRSAVLGYHKQQCDNASCKHEHISYNSCRNRHCTKCNGVKREQWVANREKDLLPVKYFHVVFTVPDKLNNIFLQAPPDMYKLLFKSAWETIQEFAADHKYLGAKTGMTCILHSWGQNLAFHPHLHCLVPAGGITKNNKWRNTNKDGKYLFPVKALSKVFRGKFCDGLIDLENNGTISLDTPFTPDKKYLHPLYDKPWVVYAKLPLHNAKQVVNYIGRYSHRIAISNHRIKAFDNGKVKFSYLNYRTRKNGVIELSAKEFLQRFALHILPIGFMKIRHYGILSARSKKMALAIARKDLGGYSPVSVTKVKSWQEIFEAKFGRNPELCPKCKKGKLKIIASVSPKNRGSPEVILKPNTNFSTSIL